MMENIIAGAVAAVALALVFVYMRAYRSMSASQPWEYDEQDERPDA